MNKTEPDGHESPLVVFLLVNPLLHRPFYVGVKRAGARAALFASTQDRVACRQITEALRGAGVKVQMVAIGQLDMSKGALEVEAYWVKLLLRGGIDVVNCQAPDATRARALQQHLAACAGRPPRAAAAATQAELPFGPPPAGPLPPPPAASPTLAGAPHAAGAPATGPRGWSPQEEQALRAQFMDGTGAELLAERSGRSLVAVLQKLLALSQAHPELLPRMVRSKLIGGSMGVYRINQRLLAPDATAGARAAPRRSAPARSLPAA